MASECIFCKILKKQIPAKIEYEDDKVLAFYDINPQAPVHLLVIPKKHTEKISDLKDADDRMIGNLILTAKNIAAQKGWGHYRLIVNNGEEAGQSVFHIHLHLLSGRQFAWPPG